MVEMKKILVLFIILLISCKGHDKKMNSSEDYMSQSAGLNQSCYHKNSEKPNCYNLSLKWNIKDTIFIDTLLSVRNIDTNDESKRVICDSNDIDLEYDTLIWNYKLISIHLTYLDRLNKFALIGYKSLPNSNIEAHFYLVDKTDLKVVEMHSFLLAQNKIIGIKMFPFLTEFTPITEFEKDKFISPDPNELLNSN